MNEEINTKIQHISDEVNSHRLISLVLEEDGYFDKIIETYRDNEEFKRLLETNNIGLVIVTYSNEKVSNASMGDVMPGIPNWYFYNGEGVINRRLIGRFSPQDIIKELKAFYKLK